MTLNSFQLGSAFKLMLRTLPIIGIRLGANILFGLALLVYLAITGWVAYLVGNAIQIVGVILFIVALVPSQYSFDGYNLYNSRLKREFVSIISTLTGY